MCSPCHRLMQIRHNLAVGRSPPFVGAVVSETRHPHLKEGNDRVFRMRWRIGAAIVALAGCAAGCALLWPHARDAGALLAAQDDPVELSDLRLNSVLRN